MPLVRICAGGGQQWPSLPRPGRFLLEEPGFFWHLVHRGLPRSHDRGRQTASSCAHAAALNWQRSTFRTRAS
jgi:hypothetical protein